MYIYQTDYKSSGHISQNEQFISMVVLNFCKKTMEGFLFEYMTSCFDQGCVNILKNVFICNIFVGLGVYNTV